MSEITAVLTGGFAARSLAANAAAMTKVASPCDAVLFWPAASLVHLRGAHAELYTVMKAASRYAIPGRRSDGTSELSA